jgi:t-SNARE complex subunit (syntaxin)
MLWSSVLMDEMSLVDLLVNSSPLAGFAIYLVTQNKSMSKKVDEINDKSEARSEILTERFEAREAHLRERYDVVISDLQREKEAIKDDSIATISLLSNKLDALERHIQDVDKKFDQIISQLQQLSTTVQELRIKDIARDTKGK